MGSVRLRELVDQLARPGSRLPLGEGAAQKGAVRYVLNENPRFVAPTLTAKNKIIPGSTSVLLLEAPAAVGKSTVAEQVALWTGAPLWDLGRKTVGHNFIAGAIEEAFGRRAVSDVLDHLDAGEFLLLFDALDETQVRSRDGFDAFLEDICQRFEATTPKAVLVLFARSVTAEWVALWLEEGGVPFARYEIDYFGEEEANAFLDRYLESAGVHKRGEAFIRARDLLFRFVIQGLGVHSGKPWDDPLVQSFLGYAYVLVAIADLFRTHGNYQSLGEELKRYAGSEAWRLLIKIVEDLLERERRVKFLETAAKENLGKKAVALGWQDWDLLYRADEQCRRILGRIYRVALRDPDPELPLGLLDEYRRLVQAQLVTHPFLVGERDFAGPVFRDYLHARCLLGLDDNEPDLRRAVRRSLAQTQPTPLLGRFLLAETDNVGLRASDFGFAYGSLLSQTKQGEILRCVLRPGANGRLVGQVGKTSFDLVRPDEGVTFWRWLRYADVDVDCDVTLGIAGEGFDLGPDVDITCNGFGCKAGMIRIIPETRPEERENQQVVIDAGKYLGDSNPQINTYERDLLRVRWEQVDYPWAQYKIDETKQPPVSQEVMEAYKHLTRLAGCFKAEGYGTLACYREVVERVGAGWTSMGRDLLDFALRRKLVESYGSDYKLNRTKMNEVGLNWADRRQRKLNDRLVQFLREFLEWRSG